ncbi:MAG TPA: glycoside hydrolase family 95 protein [Tepidisphaeraceae bacterium]|nr:glycoside hydrolase family 95 protein [Tepidisphaeraceae bacterium]
MKPITIAIALGVLFSLPSLAAEPARDDLKLWYAQPAPLAKDWTYPKNPLEQTKAWLEALPVGSGRLGAMVFGGAAEERIQFNEDTLWAGKPHDYVREGAGEHLPFIRQQAFANLKEDTQEAEALNKLIKEKFLSNPVRQKAYQPFGDIRLTFPGHEDFSNYRRELDLDSAIARTTYKVGDVTYTREVFASYPDDVIVVRITAEKPGKVNFTLKLDSPHERHETKVVGNDTISLSGQVIDRVPKDEPGTRFESRIRVVNDGGSVSTSGDAITVENADAATLLLVAATSFVNFQDVSGDPAARSQAYMQKLGDKAYDALKQEHVADHQRLFRRVSFDLGRTDRADLPTDERLKHVIESSKSIAGGNKDKPKPDALPREGLDADPALAALYFQYGRYMLIGSSRPGTQAANLQGVWNELLNPPWESKYTTNINFEMNYWPAEVTNLSELHEPMFAMIDDLRVSGARTAKKMYDSRGWVLHHNTDLWRGTAPINNIDGLWPTGAAWLSHHLWERYLFTRDKEFLAIRAYPAMKEASQFFVDFLIKDPTTRYLVTNPSHSPEHAAPGRALISYGPTMDNQLIRSLLSYTIEASEILGVDSDFAQKLADIRKQLPPNQIGRHGQLQEWIQDLDEPDNNHRHMSPLWGLYPGWDITPADTKVFDAAKVLLKWRGDGSTGWSFGWRIPLWARAYDGEYAYRQLHLQLAKRTLPNLFDLCGPFQADGNFGATGGIAEMLLQSHLRPTENRDLHEIHLLPALPSAWPKGSINGLRARGGFEVNMTWDGGELTKATITSQLGNPCRLRLGDKTVDLKTEKGKSYTFDAQLARSNQQ